MIEDIAELIWRSEYRRAASKERSVPWCEVAEGDQEKYRHTARDIVAFLKQKGIQ